MHPAHDSVAQLREWKRRFGPGQGERLRELLGVIDRAPAASASGLIELHEILLFLCAYPPDATTLETARAMLSAFAARVQAFAQAGGDLEALEDPDCSGIAGTGLTAVFSYEAARHLSARHGAAVRIEWDAHDDTARLGASLPRLLPLLDDDALVEAEVPWREWAEAAAGSPQAALPWLLDQIARREPGRRECADRYQTLSLPLRWELGNGEATRTHMRLPHAPVFFHDAPLIRRQEIRLDEIPSLAPLPGRAVPEAEAEQMLMLARDTSAARFRELYGFNYGDSASMREFDAGRGVRFFLWEVERAHRLPLRAYHAATIWKNGIPIGYFEALSLFDRMEAGFNLYYTFREGETAWLYRQLLRLFHHELGIRVVALDPYQIGYKNHEAIESGAFWFYRKLGFRSVNAAARKRTAQEEKRIAAEPGYRSAAATLRKLVEHPMVLELPGAAADAWDDFSARQVGLRAARGRSLEGGGLEEHWQPLLEMARADAEWSAMDVEELRELVREHAHASDAAYLRRMQGHARLRALFLRLGARES